MLGWSNVGVVQAMSACLERWIGETDKSMDGILDRVDANYERLVGTLGWGDASYKRLVGTLDWDGRKP